MSSAVNPVSTQTSTTPSSSSTATTAAINATDSLGNEDTFLQLLVAQIQNQDPTNPVDSNTFLTQLAEFSQLEQLIGIRQDVSQLDPTTTGSTTTSTTPTDGTTSTQN